MSFYGQWETYKIVYYPKDMTGGKIGVAFVEAGDRAHAMYVFQQQYAGRYQAVKSCEKLIGNSGR